MTGGGFVLKLNRDVWDRAAAAPPPSSSNGGISGQTNNAGPSSSNAQGSHRRKKRSGYSSDECGSCGAIALAGQDRCIACLTGRTELSLKTAASSSLSSAANTTAGSDISVSAGGALVNTSVDSASSSSISNSDTKSIGIAGTGIELKPLQIPVVVPKAMPRFSLSSGGKTPSIITTRKLSSSECSQLVEREINYIQSLLNIIPPSELNMSVHNDCKNEGQLSTLGTMTYRQVAQHLTSLRIEPIQKLFRPILTKYMQHPRNLQGVFNRPVDVGGEGLANYGEKVPIPMDLGTVRSKLQRGQFESVHTSMTEMRLVFQNAMAFNPEGHTIHTLAKALATELDVDLQGLEDKCVKDTERRLCHPSSCRLCGGEQCNICGDKCIKFESPVLLCHGVCMGRVKRNSVYYVSSDGMMLWCQRCYSGLPQVIVEGTPTADPPKPTVTKRSLLRCKSDEEVSEPWVECETCNKWVHQVCALYNDRYEEEDASPDATEAEILKREPSVVPLAASSLPRTRLSDFIESMVKEQLRATGYSHVIPSVTIRMASNVDQYVEVPESIRENLMSQDGNQLPKYLEYKQKCILLFQNIEGVDICLFSLYVQEFGANCPEPNKSTVYISYLDSVDYFRPVEVRTMVYHEIMIAYLKWSQLRGFKQGHIWSCPPQRGDNFIFWCHPSHQRTPSRERLNSWYSTMLSRATHLGLVGDVTNLFEKYFTTHLKKERDYTESRNAARNSFAKEDSEKIKAPICPPIFEGDFWVNEYIRLHRLINNRMSGDDGKDVDANRRKAREWLKNIMSVQAAQAFSKPVDHLALNLLDYPTIIKTPMDLSSVREKLRLVEYETMFDLVQDVRLTFVNAMTYNPPSHYIHENAAKLMDRFEGLVRTTMIALCGAKAQEDMDIDEINVKLTLLPLGGGIAQQGKAVALPLAAEPAHARQNAPHNKQQGPNDDSSGNSLSPHMLVRSRVFLSLQDLVPKKMARRPMHAVPQFEKAVMGPKATAEVMLELARAVDRLKADLFVVVFTDPSAPVGPRSMGSAHQKKHQAQLQALIEEEKAEEEENERRMDEEGAGGDAGGAIDGDGDGDDVPTTRLYCCYYCRHCCRCCCGLGIVPSRRAINTSGSVIVQSDNEIQDYCLALTQGIIPDTSDPDSNIASPFIDSRHTFLEMCQFRHYQFDSLRRAKHSSMMVLYHLHNPYGTNTRPTCVVCRGVIVDVRWHCGDGCADSDTCQECYISTEHVEPLHKLTPYRVTFM
eukprot:GSChrysophyteH2.ASY1.ANO1.1617.1 assembled CDS